MAEDTQTRGTWKVKADEKRDNILNQIPKEWRLKPEDIEKAKKKRDLTGFVAKSLDDTESAIVQLTTKQILAVTKESKYSVLQVTEAFCHAAAIAHQVGNCLLEFFPLQAIERAKKLDQDKNAGKPLGPLHGLPISLKDQFHVKGVDTTMGYVGWVGGNMGIDDPGRFRKVESQTTAELLKLGAVLYCKTSVPQTLLTGITHNNIIGTTLNPYNQGLSCGGSSGGEGALIALDGSPLGVGTDVGGSVRIPAASCGLFGLKPTPERLSYKDMANTDPGQTTYRSAVGYLSKTLDGIELLFEAVLKLEPWVKDTDVVPIPFREEILKQYQSCGSRSWHDHPRDAKSSGFPRPLKLGILWRDGIIEPHPPVQRAMKIVRAAVEAAGHQVIEWKPPSHKEAYERHMSFIVADGADHVAKQLARSGEPLIPHLKEILKHRQPMGLLDFEKNTLEAKNLEDKFNKCWLSTGDNEDGDNCVDAYISPAIHCAASIPDQHYGCPYTQVVNLMNWAAVVIPVAKANKIVDKADEAWQNYEPVGIDDRRNWESYDPALFDGCPVGIQIVTRKFEEEKALGIARVVHDAVEGYKKKNGEGNPKL